MRDLDEVVGGIEEECVQTELATNARGHDGRGDPAFAAALHLAGDLQRRAARCVLLLGVVALLHPGRVLREPREELTGATSQGKDDVRTRREVRGVDATNSG